MYGCTPTKSSQEALVYVPSVSTMGQVGVDTHDDTNLAQLPSLIASNTVIPLFDCHFTLRHMVKNKCRQYQQSAGQWYSNVHLPDTPPVCACNQAPHRLHSVLSCCCQLHWQPQQTSHPHERKRWKPDLALSLHSSKLCT